MSFDENSIVAALDSTELIAALLSYQVRRQHYDLLGPIVKV